MAARRTALVLSLLLAGTALCYSRSLADTFLNYDDRWLVAQNTLLVGDSEGALGKILFDLSPETRYRLGAEYLPVRDLSVWLEARLCGASARAMRIGNLVLYLLCCAFVWFAGSRILRSSGRDSLPALTAAVAVFAFHPVHVESVAWIAGRKDVLAMAFMACGFFVYAGSSRVRPFGVALLFVLATLSKSMACAGVALLPLLDALAGRRVDWKTVVIAALPVAAVLAVQIHVGSLMNMVAEPVGGSRTAALFTMTGVLFRYARMLFLPVDLSVIYDVDVLGPTDWQFVVAMLLLAAGILLAVRAWRRGQRLPGLALLWFLIPLAPVNQVMAPLQNSMADRYLWWSVVSLSVLFGWAVMRYRAAQLLCAAWITGFALLSFQRAPLFADSVALFADATERTVVSTLAPYQLGRAYQERGDIEKALDAFTLSFARGALPSHAPRRHAEAGQSAATNLSNILATNNRLAAAEKILRDAIARWPTYSKLHGNLAEVVARQGRLEEARALYLEIFRRFPDYELARQNYARWFGAPPPG